MAPTATGFFIRQHESGASKGISTKSYSPAVAFFGSTILLAHLAARSPYTWHRHTLSQLAAQGYANAWIMRIGLVGFGVLILATGIFRIRSSIRLWYREVPILLYGLAILLSGLFSTSPFIDGAPFSEPEARLHSIFATSAGVTLTAGVLLYALTDPPRRFIHLIALVLITAVSMLFGSFPAVAGVFQRLLWIIGFVWLVYISSIPLLTQHSVQTAGAVEK